MYGDMNQLHNCLNFLLEINIFKDANKTHPNIQNLSLYNMMLFLQPHSSDQKHETIKIRMAMQTRTNCISVWIFCYRCTFSKMQRKHIRRWRIHRSRRWLYFQKQIHLLKFRNSKELVFFCTTHQPHQCLNFSIEISIFERYKENTSKDAGFIALQNNAFLRARFICCDSWNGKNASCAAIDTKRISDWIFW